MDFYCNGKPIEIELNSEKFKRHTIKTDFVKQGEDYIDIISKYVSPVYEEGDILSICEKVISLCQGRIVKREDIKIGFWAKFLAKFAGKTPAGIGVGEPIKMQYAINKAGLLKVIYASICSAVTKLFGKKGVFYNIVGQDVAGLDGFYPKVWKEYADIGIELPENPTGVCNEIKEKLGISCYLVDANDLSVEILGHSADLSYTEDELKELIKDNPAGQGKELTPFVLIRPTSE
jgi:F420-0:gamma-glutamyl ligase-like protein